jgi:hypothetical protein
MALHHVPGGQVTRLKRGWLWFRLWLVFNF